MVKENQENNRLDILNEPLAIIGINCQFPGIDSDVEDVDSFYAMLLNGQSPVKDVPENRWDVDIYYDPDRDKPDKIIGRKGGFLKNPQLFDASFFKIAAVEAKQIDPQHRLFLEVAIRALNHANITLGSLSDSNTGVFYGTSAQDYNQLNFKEHIEFNAYTQIGAACSAAAGRLSHFLNLKGPSMAVDTACSSSLTALCLAATALRMQQCSMAIVGGVHLNLCPENFIGLTKANMLSARDQCSSFDINADGFVRSEGCGVVIVKRLSDAIKDNDTIHAVIKSVVMNHDGDDGTVLVAPNIKAQIAMHQAALAQANLTASDIDYIEAHGTGTVVGDSVEFNAIQYIHQGHHSQDKPLVIGALKSNMGHSIASSGIASLIKAIGALKYEMIPPNLHYSKPNKTIDPESIPALLPVTAVSFEKQTNKKRHVQISNFGFSGTNVSAIIEEPERFALTQSIPDDEQLKCFVISANSASSLKQMMTNFISYLRNTSASLHDICYTLTHCRDHYKYRCAIIANNKEALIQKIEFEDYELKKVVVKKEIKKISDDAEQIYEAYLAGFNLKTAQNDTHFNKVDLPLYFFDRKPYWHEPRRKNWQNPTVNVLNNEPIAIIGMSCRFPKAENIDEFLFLLEHGESGMTDISLERWDNEKYYDPDVNALGRLCIKQLGQIENIKNFDADFFNISPREAKFLSPQVRVFLETSYHALEDANLSLASVKDSKTGVFVGCGTNEYPRLLVNLGMSLDDLNIYYSTGNVLNAIPGRVAYSFDFHGPIQTIDTACSSSMTAIHDACLSLQSGDCDMALAGGINILLIPDSSIALSKARMLSPESRCKTFSEDADGYARSEGCGVVVLKRLSTAFKDNDNILAVIKGTSVNSDGKSSGFTVPNGIAQEEVIRSALAKAKLSPADIDYIEAHGTGTPLADPIEVNTLTKIFSEYHSKEKPLYISSVKTNIGHSESAAGVAGVIKAVLSLQTHKLFKHLNFKKLNPDIELKNTIIPLNTMDWPKGQDLRCAGVSSFGFSGANAHVILQEAPERKKEARTLPHEFLLILSAKSKTALELLLISYQKFLENTNEEFADICYTAATCRSHFLYRVAIKANTAKEAAAVIEKNECTIYQIKKDKNNPSSLQHTMTLEQLQADYQAGVMINWLDFYKSLNCQFEKVKLPLYKFAREEHWFEDKSKLKDAPMPKDWCFQLQWQQQPCNKTNRKTHGNNWLLIGARQLAPGFTAQGLHIVSEDDAYPLEKLDGIIFALGLDSLLATDIESRIDFQKKIIKKLLGLVKELNNKAIKLQLIVLTTNAIAELAAGELNLSNSPLIGFCRTLVLEVPQFHTILIDSEETEAENYSAQIVDEINHNYDQHYEHIVAYRNGKRLIARLKKTKLQEKKRSLHGEGRYLITGGSGGLGLVTAQALLSAGAREIILTSRNIDKPAIKEAIKKIQLNYPDRTIRTISLDITDKEKLRSLLLDLNANGLLKGIIHAAGAAIKAPLLEHKDEDVDYLFSAKVKGGWYLHELSQNFDLDFFVVYSSISSLFGSNKESVYSATNSFLDALIAERQCLGLVGTVINWGPWAEVGMARKRAQDRGLIHSLMSNEQGHTLIKILINNQLSHAAIISPEYLKFMLDFVPKPLPAFHRYIADELLETEKVSDKNLSTWLNDYLQINNENRLEACKEMIRAICKETLELSDSEDLDEDEGFFEIGFDSLTITEIATRLKEKLEPSLKVTATIGFDYPSINKLSQYIESELDQHLIQKQAPKSVSGKIDDAIAIIGMSCRFPNAPDIAAFEALLEEGQSGMKEISIERWDNRKYYDPNVDAPGKSYVNKLGLIDNIKCFDANFFGISPREAKLMEPQQRIFLECSYKALENANYSPASLRGSLTGVFAGVGPNEYYLQLEKSSLSNDELSAYLITGNVSNLISGRVAYIFDFKGPSISIDTACSSSLVAIHYACQSLKNREIDYALAGGVNVLLMPESNITLCKAKALSPDGQCKTFDEHADGYARAEGCGVIFLKRMSEALRDKDTILAVIKASAINNDGKSAGLTVPNGISQEEVMRKALSQTDLSSNDISYIEAHGTGTPLGDPIEVNAINNVYGKGRGQDNPLYLGTVKTNIGHLESAAGVASIIKTVISLQKKKIYKLLNFKKLNPHINLGDTRLALQKIDWSPNSKLNSAGINAFGFSGTNAHVILQEFPRAADQRSKSTKPIKTQLLVLSAKSQTALEHLAQSYKQYLAMTSDDFGDICFTAATCREHYAYRLALAAENAQEASRLLETGQFALSKGKNNTLDLQNAHALKSVLTVYMQGKQVDWALYYKTSGYEFTKVSLPTYTFDLIEFWVNKKGSKIVPSDIVHPLFYHTKWSTLKLNLPTHIEVPELLIISNDPVKAKTVLGNLNYQLIHNLSELNLNSAVESTTDGYCTDSTAEFRLKNIEKKNIVFLYDQSQFNNLFHCCQKLFKLRPTSFILVTENAYAIDDKDEVNPYHTMASSFWKSFSNELELNKNYTIDLDTNSTLPAVLKYIFTTNSSENQFAVRDSIYIPRLKKTQLHNNLSQEMLLNLNSAVESTTDVYRDDSTAEFRFKSDASYLITGGTGGLAKALIEYLMHRGAQHIIITSRSECSSDIQAMIEHARKKQVFIKHYQADASNYQQMESIIAEIEHSSKPLQGVFHLAGIVHDDLILNLSDEEMQSVLSAKMDSALILHQLTKNIPLDLFVLFSSAASVLGSRRQANYVAANGFLDGLAHLRQRQGLPAIAINWGPFQSRGMTANLTQALQQRGFILLDKNSIDILDVLLRSQLAQIAVCPIHWDIYCKYTPQQAFLSELVKGTLPAKQHFLNSLRYHTKEECITILSQALCEITRDVLGLDEVDQIKMDDGLFSLGLDSLMAIEIRNGIHDKLQCPTLNLSIEYFINEPTIRKIATSIVEEVQNFFDFDKKIQDQAVKNPIGEEVALCDFQYIFWVLNKLDYPYNIGTQLQIQGKLNKDYVSQVFDFVVKNNSAFWLYFNKDVPIQVLKKQGQFELIYQDISLNDEQKVLHQEFQNNMMREIPLTKQPLIRVYLYKINSDLHELHIVIPHIIVEGTSCDIVLSQFKKGYEALALGKKLIQEPEKDSFLNFVKKNNHLYEINLEDKINFWRNYNKGFKMLYLRPEYYMSDPDIQNKYLFHYPINSRVAEQFIEWHRTKNINVSTGLIAACHLAFYKISHQKKMPFIQIHSGREGSQYNSIVGLFSEYKRINSTLNEKYKFIDFIKSIDEEQLKTTPYQKCSHVIKNSEFEGSGLAVIHYLLSRWNKLWLTKSFNKSKLNSKIIDFYLKYLSWAEVIHYNASIKIKFNKLFKLGIPLQKPERLRVLLNITPSFFSEPSQDMSFANLNYQYANHFGSEDRPTSNRSLWVLFSRNQEGEYLFSLNGPVTTHCKDEIASLVNKIMAQLLENDECTLADFLRYPKFGS